MAHKFIEMKIGSVTVPHELFVKLRVGTLKISYWEEDYALLLISPHTIQAIKNRKVKPEQTPLTDKNGKPITLLGRPVFETDNNVYYDEELYQFYLQAQYEEYSIVFIHDEGELGKNDANNGD